MTFTYPLLRFQDFRSLLKDISEEDSIVQHALMNAALWDPEEEEPEEDHDFEENYGDLENGHDDLNEQDAERGVDNLE